MSAWMINIMAGLYLGLLFLVHKDPMGVTLWVLGFCFLTYRFRRSR